MFAREIAIIIFKNFLPSPFALILVLLGRVRVAYTIGSSWTFGERPGAPGPYPSCVSAINAIGVGVCQSKTLCAGINRKQALLYNRTSHKR